jgi:hypothetical protein
MMKNHERDMKEKGRRNVGEGMQEETETETNVFYGGGMGTND